MLADTPDGCVVNVGSGGPTSVTDLADVLMRASGFRVPVSVTGQYRVGDIRHCFADIGRLQRLLGVRPRVSLKSGIERFCAWAGGQPVHADRLDAATDELRRKGLAGA